MREPAVFQLDMFRQLPSCGSRSEVIDVSPIPAANVSTVPQRSPLRYPGGKTWLIPHIRAWLSGRRMQTLVEPFAGGGIVSLTAVMENLVGKCVMAELDPEVAAFWHAALHHNNELCKKIKCFKPERAAVEQLIQSQFSDVINRGFRTLVLNRTRRGGILAPGASLTRNGEDGKGIASRWYPQTLIRRLKAIDEHKDLFYFQETDGMTLIEEFSRKADKATCMFIDSPYTAGGKNAGSRLYTYNQLDHPRLFQTLAKSSIDFLMTYSETPEVIALAQYHSFQFVRVFMKTTHHARIPELVITRYSLFNQ